MTEWIISSSAIILIVIALRGLLKGKISLRLQYGLWAIVLVRLLVPISFFQSDLSVSNLVDTVQQQFITQDSGTSVQEYEDAYNAAAQRYEAQGVQASQDQLRQEAQDQIYHDTYNHIANNYAQSGTVVPDVQIQTEAQNRVESISNQAMVADLLPYLWIAGMILVGGVLVVSNLHFTWKLRRTRQRLVVDEIPLKVYLTGYVATPCLFGIGKPDIYLTDEVLTDSEMRQHVLAHEFSHYRQKDHIWSVLRSVCLVLHWYNPLVWAAAILSKQDAELACDEATIKTLGEDQRVAYGKTLIGMTCVKQDPRSLLLTATTMLGSKKTLKERISLIAAKPKTALYTLIACILVVSLAVGCTFSGSGDPTEPTEQEDVIWEKLSAAVDAENSAEGRHFSIYYTPENPIEIDLNDYSKTNECWMWGEEYYLTLFEDDEPLPHWLYYDGKLYSHVIGDQWLVSESPDADSAFDIPLPSRRDYTMTWTETEEYLEVVFKTGEDETTENGTLIFRLDPDGKLLWYSVSEDISGTNLDGEQIAVTMSGIFVLHEITPDGARQKVENSAAEILANMVEWDPDTDLGPGNSPPLETVEPITYPELPDASAGRRMLTAEELAEFAAMFQWTSDGYNWYNYALKSEYSTPADLDLLEFFYSAPLENLTQEDLDFYGEAASQLHKYSVSVMNEVLDTYFGIGFHNTNGVGLDQMVYNEERGCYYHAHGDLRASYHTFLGGYVNPNNTVELYYTDPIASVEEDVIRVVTLQHVDQGTHAPNWHIVSNVKVGPDNYAIHGLLDPETEMFFRLFHADSIHAGIYLDGVDYGDAGLYHQSVEDYGIEQALKELLDQFEWTEPQDSNNSYSVISVSFQGKIDGMPEEYPSVGLYLFVNPNDQCWLSFNFHDSRVSYHYSLVPKEAYGGTAHDALLAFIRDSFPNCEIPELTD